jgi:hypothetical protein
MLFPPARQADQSGLPFCFSAGILKISESLEAAGGFPI